jgi:hypothetical protein
MKVPAFGMTGGISNGVIYFVTDPGSNVPPEIAAYTFCSLPPSLVVKNRPAPAAAVSFRNPRLLAMIELLIVTFR